MQVNQFRLLTEYEDCCARSRYQGQWQVITTRSIYVEVLHFFSYIWFGEGLKSAYPCISVTADGKMITHGLWQTNEWDIVGVGINQLCRFHQDIFRNTNVTLMSGICFMGMNNVLGWKGLIKRYLASAFWWMLGWFVLSYWTETLLLASNYLCKELQYDSRTIPTYQFNLFKTIWDTD